MFIRTALSVVMVAGLTAGVVAQDPAMKPVDPAKPTTTEPAKPAETRPAGESPTAPTSNVPNVPPAVVNLPPAPPAPKGLPVPDMPLTDRKELEGGLIIEEMKVGTGYEVKEGGVVVAHYHGTLKSNPTIVFDSSYERSEPAAFPLGSVIEGWKKGVPGMKIGGIRKLTVPAKMAYGEQSPKADIPPNSDLVFVVELVDALRSEDVKVGEGEPASAQTVAVINYVLKDKDGKELEKSAEGKPYILFPGENQGLSVALEGMKAGGKRIVTLPAQLNQNNPAFPEAAGRANGQPVSWEVELVHFRNLPTGPQGGQGGGRRR